jgi:hypothetical protein
MCRTLEIHLGLKSARVWLIVCCLALISLSQAVALDKTADAKRGPAANAEGDGGTKAFWIGAVLVVLAGTAGTAVLIKKVKQHQALNPSAAKSHHNGKNGFPLVNGARRATNGSVAKAVKAPNGLQNGKQRRRVFNYEKFYTEMVLQGPAPVIGMEEGAIYELENGRYATQMVSAQAAPVDSGNMMGANSEMISHQKNLIEEQKRLIEEQARLIAEKSMLILEKNQLLKRQSELVNNNLL